jgi:hypothetical protein
MDGIGSTGRSAQMMANIGCLEANQRLSRPNRARAMVSDMSRSVFGGYLIILGRWRQARFKNSGEIPVKIPVPGHFLGFLVPESPETFF